MPCLPLSVLALNKEQVIPETLYADGQQYTKRCLELIDSSAALFPKHCCSRHLGMRVMTSKLSHLHET